MNRINNLKKINKYLLIAELYKYLYLCSKAKISLAPSQIIDLAWHELILFTKFYDRFCNENLGKFIHHMPNNDARENHLNYFHTIKQYIFIFGKPEPNIWGEFAQKEWELFNK